LGLDQSKEAYRNYFAAGENSTYFPILEKLVTDGLMVRRDDPFNEMSKSYIYHCTEKGKAVAKESKKQKVESGNKTNE
jgi:DNA-binding PadR family transcriptional regulator